METEREIYFKELGYRIVRTGKSKIHRAKLALENQGRVDVVAWI